MDKFLAYMAKKAKRAQSLDRKMLIDEAINYVEGLEVFFDVAADDVPEYAQELIDRGRSRSEKCMRLVIKMHAEWVRMGSK